MVRRDGRATPGPRVVDHVPDSYGVNYTMLATLGLNGLQAPWVVDGAVNGDIFCWWVRGILGPTLRPGDIVLWDNLSAHKVAGVEELLTACGARLIRLAPSSPDFNPIEPCWSKMKTGLRRGATNGCVDVSYTPAPYGVLAEITPFCRRRIARPPRGSGPPPFS
jgi:transposase